MEQNHSRGSKILAMPAPRGRAHRGRTGAFSPDKSIRASVELAPSDPVRKLYEELIQAMGVSGSEVVRQAITELHAKKCTRAALQEAG